MALLEISQLDAFHGRARSLHDLSLSVGEGSIVAVVGMNGAGKSTLMDAILGLVRSQGTLRLGGRSILGLRSAEIVRLGVGYAPERAHLFPWMSIRDHLLLGGYTARGEIARNLERVYRLFPLLGERSRQEAGTLSGGERQMVSLARALMTGPRLLLVDEPTIGLAPKICGEIAVALRRLNQEEGLTLLIAEQNIQFALQLASEVHVLESGQIRISGTPEALAADEDLNRVYFGL